MEFLDTGVFFALFALMAITQLGLFVWMTKSDVFKGKPNPAAKFYGWVPMRWRWTIFRALPFVSAVPVIAFIGGITLGLFGFRQEYFDAMIVFVCAYVVAFMTWPGCVKCGAHFLTRKDNQGNYVNTIYGGGPASMFPRPMCAVCDHDHRTDAANHDLDNGPQ